jgi:hypothetical protein
MNQPQVLYPATAVYVGWLCRWEVDVDLRLFARFLVRNPEHACGILFSEDQLEKFPGLALHFGADGSIVLFRSGRFVMAGRPDFGNDEIPRVHVALGTCFGRLCVDDYDLRVRTFTYALKFERPRNFGPGQQTIVRRFGRHMKAFLKADGSCRLVVHYPDTVRYCDPDYGALEPAVYAQLIRMWRRADGSQ